MSALLPPPKSPCRAGYKGSRDASILFPLGRTVSLLLPQHLCHFPSTLEPDGWATSQSCESVKSKFMGKGHGAPPVNRQETQQALVGPKSDR